MRTISDILAYGLISGLCTKGFKACLLCGPETEAQSAKVGALKNDRRATASKVVYGGGRRWSRSRNHPYRNNLRINGKVEHRGAHTNDGVPSIARDGKKIKVFQTWRQS